MATVNSLTTMKCCVDGIVKIYACKERKSAFFIFETATKAYSARQNMFQSGSDLLRDDDIPKEVEKEVNILHRIHGVTGETGISFKTVTADIGEVIKKGLFNYRWSLKTAIDVPVVYITADELGRHPL